MELPQNKSTPDDIRLFWETAQLCLKDWDTIKSSTSAAEFSAYREMISTASHGIETILESLEGQHSDVKRKIGAVKLLLRDLKRHDDLAKDRYWTIRKAL